jgi:SAM-dependent methyltransferase
VPGFVRGEATALPFEDESFDYVASVDVYEHIDHASRERNLSELRRVARRGVLLAGPFDSDAVRAAERVANECHRAVHLTENVWLKEHAENGLPQLVGTREFFEGRGDSVSVLRNGHLFHWLAMMCLTHYRSKLEGELARLFDDANAFYKEFVYGSDNAEPCYRCLLV